MSLQRLLQILLSLLPLGGLAGWWLDPGPSWKAAVHGVWVAILLLGLTGGVAMCTKAGQDFLDHQKRHAVTSALFFLSFYCMLFTFGGAILRGLVAVIYAVTGDLRELTWKNLWPQMYYGAVIANAGLLVILVLRQIMMFQDRQHKKGYAADNR